MAVLTGGTVGAVRFDTFTLANDLDGDVTSATSTQVVVNTGGGYTITYAGTGITFNNAGQATGGTALSITERLNGSVTYTLTGLSIPVTTLVGWIERNVTSEALNVVFGGDDNITGTTFNDGLLGFAGHDNIFGGAGADTLSGGAGNDHLYGQSANGGSDGADLISGDAGSDYIQGNAGNDTLNGGDGSDRINGGGDNDLINAGNDNDTVNGNLGNDTIAGDAGNDSLRGGQGNDSIRGGEGNDMISGDLGADTLTGGAGVDIFLFGGSGSLLAGSSPDVVTDYQDGTDRIHVGYVVEAVLTGTAADLTAATTAAQALFDGRAGGGEVAVIAVGADAYLFYSSVNGGAANSAVVLTGISPSVLTVSDFI